MRSLMSLALPAPSMMVVFSLSTLMVLARPSWFISVFSSFKPSSSETTWPPVSMEMSSSIALRRSPNPGAFTAQAFSVPRRLLTTSVARASPSTSSAISSSGLPDWAIFSRIGSRSFMLETFLS